MTSLKDYWFENKCHFNKSEIKRLAEEYIKGIETQLRAFTSKEKCFHSELYVAGLENGTTFLLKLLKGETK